MILLLAVLLFLFWGGPVWRRFADWNAAIAWSYAAIPAMVLALLLWRRRFHWLPWLVHTLEIAAVKFAITASVLVSVMLSRGQSPLAPFRASEERVDAGPPAPPPKVVAPDPDGGTVSGTLRGASGQAGPGWVWLDDVRGPRAGAALPTPARFTERSDGIDPDFAVVEVGEPIQIDSLDGRLHTARLKSGNGWVFNIPVPAQGHSPARAALAPAEAELGCTVHGAAERSARLVVVDHPFFTRADEGGAFTLQQIPPGQYALRWKPDGDPEGLPRRVKVEPGRAVSLDF